MDMESFRFIGIRGVLIFKKHILQKFKNNKSKIMIEFRIFKKKKSNIQKTNYKI